MKRDKFNSVDEYLSTFSGEVLDKLNEIRALIKSEAPNAEERISYNIPAYFVGKKPVIYFAGYPKHVSLYPVQGNEQRRIMNEYLSGKATVKFPIDKDLPIDLIKIFIDLRLRTA
ncbi:DUF1801 domain-containing protein [Candidatus Saccharibacteria bacterium]|nr:DUF1801 domain-containing protein [Candidatus Saccharibacteria bacterium]